MSGAATLARPLTVMLVVGEPSGDALGGQLMTGLKAIAGERVRVVGVGGPAMAAEGLESLFPLDVTAVMGLREVLPRIPAILRHVRQAADFALATRPDLVVLIDSPDFTHRIARRIKRLAPSIRTVNYVAPQVWASRAYRARKMARYMDAVLALLPFEVPFFERYGIRTFFVGHPVVERKARMVGGDAFREAYAIAPDATLLAVLPGSRMNEVRFILPPMKGAVEILAREFPKLVTVVPTLGHILAGVRKRVAGWPTPLHIVEGEREKFAAFDAADAALAASGTVTTELALSRTPFVAAYRVGWLTAVLMRPLVNVPHVTLANLLLKREAAPERLQSDCTAKDLADALRPLLGDPAARAAQLHDLDQAMHLLGQDEEAPSLRAARAVLMLAEDARSTARG